ncbi:MAG: ATP-binding protein [Atopococcus tabaci]|uniref:histidine kinase n=1 Tax=Atopococcus tabaci TaxID=269774 RepID=A0AA43UCX5_9LACT|nr:ATP-binding protein [Atopococcus tabaci]
MNTKQNKMKWYQSINIKIVFVIVVLIVFALQIIGANFITELENQLLESHKQDRQTQSDFIETSAAPHMLAIQNNRQDSEEFLSAQSEINALLNDFSGRGNISIQMITPSLIIVGTSDRTEQAVNNQRSNDAEARQAVLTAETITSEYRDAETGDRRWKMVTPVYAEAESDQLLGVVVLESNIETVYEQVKEISFIFVQSSLLAIAITILLGYVLSREIVTPIIAIQESTKKIADGDYSINLQNDSQDEIGQLTASINELALDVSSAQESIDQERRRLDRVLIHMSDGVIATDRVGKITIINDAAREILSLSKGHAEGQAILDILDLNEEISMSDLYKEKGEDHKLSIGERFIDLKFSIIESEMGFIQGIVCVLHDVTEAENIERDRKSFVSNVSHELRTPLTSMRSYVEALNDGAWKDEKIAPQFLSVIQNETNRMIRMVSDLLQLSRMDAGTEDFEKELIDLRALFNFVLDRFDMMIQSDESKNFVIARKIIPDQVWIEADQDRMAQVLDNILSNAIKYSPDGGTITASLSLKDDDVLLSIRDEGMGIPKEELPRVFSRFYRVDKARSRAMGGTGLGLAISKDVVVEHGGKIWVRSVLNQGTTFFVSLPCEQLEVLEEDDWA